MKNYILVVKYYIGSQIDSTANDDLDVLIALRKGVKACTQHSIYNHSYDIDYQATFALVAKLDTIQVLLYFEANLDWSLHQLDVKNAFLNDDLEKEMYMKISPGFKTRSNVNKVCKFWKSLYGLKQSHKAWFDRFTKAVKEHEYS
uniref:Reverse transcriptase Ty1/copia-type domain-containing protein n=1 Tax=Vitis vinifera TaxID=29760 RepID=A5ATM9_VITVI|nr:hypothetical protein VITISV_004664 [Vitis vinifera]